METLMTIFSNPVSEEREEEFNNWYSWVHIRDVMGLEGSIAVQRFVLNETQSASSAKLPKYLAFYEIASREACSKGHADRLNTWRMTVSPAFDFPSHIEGYWDPVYGTSDFAEYADTAGDRTVLIIRMASKGKKSVGEIFSENKLKELGALPGIKSALLFKYSAEQMATTKAGPAEKMSHEIVCQLSSADKAVKSWDDFLRKNTLETELELQAAIYKPVIDRFMASDRLKSAEWRAISFLSHAIMKAINNGILVSDESSSKSVW